jgi:hypothetical protein
MKMVQSIELNLRVVEGKIAHLISRRQQYAKGISIEDLNEFDLEAPPKQIACPIFCIGGKVALGFLNAIGYGGTQQFEAGCKLFSNCEEAHLLRPKSTINMIHQLPEVFCGLCMAFLVKNNLSRPLVVVHCLRVKQINRDHLLLMEW